MTVARMHRQQAEILASVRAGDLRRALVLSREHLAEFPGDATVRGAIVDHITMCGDRALQDELHDLLASGPA